MKLKDKIKHILKFPKIKYKKNASIQTHEITKHPNCFDLYGDRYWFLGQNLWEPPVLIALKDLCQPGSVVFDIGGNMGGLTSVMSRLVGPRGIVCTFEASPRIVQHLQHNVIKQGHTNVTVYHRAVFSASNEIKMMYEGENLNDSLYSNAASPNAHCVSTLALDDFCQSTNLWPDLVKIDIEGAEFDACNGAIKMIQHKPHLILEQNTQDTRCLELLKKHGYLAIDLNNYRQILSQADYDRQHQLRNVLFIHRERLQQTHYDLPIENVTVLNLKSYDFNPNHLNGYTSTPFLLDKGRYLIDINLEASGQNNNLMCGVRLNGIDIFRYHGFSQLIAHSYYDWMVDIPNAGEVQIYFDFHDNTSDNTLKIHGCQIKGFPNLASSVWANLCV
jgi:FkbM family methyltransferase